MRRFLAYATPALIAGGIVGAAGAPVWAVILCAVIVGIVIGDVADTLREGPRERDEP